MTGCQFGRRDSDHCVTGVNDAPVANAASITTDEDTVVSGSLVGSDPRMMRWPTCWSASFRSVTLQPNGSWSYDPRGRHDALKPGETATVTFSFMTNDGQLISSAQTVTILVTGVNDAPVVSGPQHAMVDEGGTVTAIFTATDPDAGDEVTLSLFSGPEGSISIRYRDVRVGCNGWPGYRDRHIRAVDSNGGRRITASHIYRRCRAEDLAGRKSHGGRRHPGSSRPLRQIRATIASIIGRSIGATGRSNNCRQGGFGTPCVHDRGSSWSKPCCPTRTANSDRPTWKCPPGLRRCKSPNWQRRFQDSMFPSIMSLRLVTSALWPGAAAPGTMSWSGCIGRHVAGSLVFDDNYRGFTFVKTGGLFAEGAYQVRLISGGKAFHDGNGSLDGDWNDAAGGDYLAEFTAISHDNVIHMSDIVRAGIGATRCGR